MKAYENLPETARVIFMEKTSLDVFSLRREQVWTFHCWVIESMRGCLFLAAGLNACL